MGCTQAMEERVNPLPGNFEKLESLHFSEETWNAQRRKEAERGTPFLPWRWWARSQDSTGPAPFRPPGIIRFPGGDGNILSFAGKIAGSWLLSTRFGELR